MEMEEKRTFKLTSQLDYTTLFLPVNSIKGKQTVNEE